MKTMLSAALLALTALASIAQGCTITSLEDFYKLLPDGIQLKQGAPSLPLAIELANREFAAKTFAQNAQMSLNFKRLESQPNTPYGNAVVGVSESESTPPSGSLMKVTVQVYFAPDCLPALATRDLSTEPLVFHGTVAKATFKEGEGEGGQTQFAIDIVNARPGLAPASAEVEPMAKVEVISAVYGGGKHQADVTERVRRYVK